MIPDLAELEGNARESLSRDVFDYLAGGADDELALRRNTAAFERILIRPRVLCGSADIDLSVNWGPLASRVPFAVAPMSYHSLAHPEGELATARAAAGVGLPLVVSTMSSVPIEQIAATGVQAWFQLYWLRNRDDFLTLIHRVLRAGACAIVVTVDTPVFGSRRRDAITGFRIPADLPAPHLPSGRPPGNLAEQNRSLFRDDLGWEDISWLCRLVDVPVYLKGVLDPRDAQHAINAGVAGIIVSNHGGRQFDAAPAAIEVAAEIAAVGRCVVLVDGGVRSGTDILRAVALGADGVLVGRPVLWGLASAGADGVRRILGALAADLEHQLRLCGCPSIAAARELIVTWAS